MNTTPNGSELRHLSMGQITKDQQARSKNIEIIWKDEANIITMHIPRRFKQLFVPKTKRTVAKAISMGYNWQVPANQHNSAKWMLLWEDGTMTNAWNAPAFILRAFKKVSSLRFILGLV